MATKRTRIIYVGCKLICAGCRWGSPIFAPGADFVDARANTNAGMVPCRGVMFFPGKAYRIDWVK